MILAQHKPGWISTVPGSVLHVVVDTNLGSLESRKTISITYLISHQHMGQVNVSCIVGCTCHTITINGHSQHHKHSVLWSRDLTLSSTMAGNYSAMPGRQLPPPPWSTAPISRHPAAVHNCTLRIEVLSATESGEHKFKVVQLVVKSWLDMSTSASK